MDKLFRKINWFLLLIIATLCGCASLTKSQLKEIEVFGKLTKNFSVYPGKVVTQYNAVHQQQQLFQANALATPKAHFDALAEASSFKIKSDLIAPKIDLSLKIIEQYADALLLLTADRYSKRLDTAATNLGLSLDKLVTEYNTVNPAQPVPIGIGAGVGQLVLAGGRTIIRRKQAEEIKRIVPLADTMIGVMSKNLLQFLDGETTGAGSVTLKQLIETEKTNVARSYTGFLGLNKQNVNFRKGNDTTRITGSIVHQRFAGLEDDRECLRLLENLHLTEQLRQQCITAVVNMRAAHRNLLVVIQQKRKLSEFIPELQLYGEDIKKINKSIQSVK